MADVARSDVYKLFKGHASDASLYRMMVRLPIIPLRFQMVTPHLGQRRKEREPVYCSVELERVVRNDVESTHHKRSNPDNKLAQLRVQLLDHLESLNAPKDSEATPA